MARSTPSAEPDEVATLRRLVDLNLDNIDLRVKLIERLTKLGRDSDAVEKYLIAVNAAPTRGAELADLVGGPLKRGDGNRQLADFFRRHIIRAEQFVEAGDYDRAIFYYRIAYAQQAFRWPLTQLLQRRNPAAIAALFHQYHYYSLAWMQNRWMGVPIQKNPLDLWIIQEILHEVQPDILVETGTFLGGSAL
jgi:tetratricopeptide (TPR) repeat protein